MIAAARHHHDLKNVHLPVIHDEANDNASTTEIHISSSVPSRNPNYQQHLAAHNADGATRRKAEVTAVHEHANDFDFAAAVITLALKPPSHETFDCDRLADVSETNTNKISMSTINTMSNDNAKQHDTIIPTNHDHKKISCANGFIKS